MRIVRAALEPIEWRLRTGIRTGSQKIDVRAGIQVALCEASGLRGVGEALPLPVAGTEPMHETAATMIELCKRYQDAPVSLEELLVDLDSQAPGAPAARCGFDVAAHDLEARLRGKPVCRLLDPEPRDSVSVNALIAEASSEALRAATGRAIERGFTTLKIKVGRTDPDTDVERVRCVRELAGPDIRLRLDANESWSRDAAERALLALEPLDIELVEQPVSREDLEGLAHLHRISPIPIAVDESLAIPDGRTRLYRNEIAGVAVLKPMVLGGLGHAARLAREARARGIRCIVTTTLDGPIGTAAALHLASAVGNGDLAHGLAAVDSVATDFPPGLHPVGGRLRIDAAPGLGSGLEVRISPERNEP